MLIYAITEYDNDINIMVEKGHAPIRALKDDAPLAVRERILASCDAIVLRGKLQDAYIATLDFAKTIKLPIYVVNGAEELPDLHPTEVNSPEQCREFMQVLGQMYRTHLDKNADYSPANILATGEIGLVTRLWDKTARLLNLYGFRFKVETGTLSAPRSPKNESIDDTLIDSAVYSIIGLLLRRNKWGK